jgi:hypothetical protein
MDWWCWLIKILLPLWHSRHTCTVVLSMTVVCLHQYYFVTLRSHLFTLYCIYGIWHTEYSINKHETMWRLYMHRTYGTPSMSVQYQVLLVTYDTCWYLSQVLVILFIIDYPTCTQFHVLGVWHMHSICIRILLQLPATRYCVCLSFQYNLGKH